MQSDPRGDSQRKLSRIRLRLVIWPALHREPAKVDERQRTNAKTYRQQRALEEERAGLGRLLLHGDQGLMNRLTRFCQHVVQ